MLGSAVLAQAPVLPDRVRAAADAITADALARDVEFLASDALRGRNTPSPGFDEAAAFIAKRLATAGLTPQGDNGTYFQRYEMHESRVDPAAATLEIDGRRFSAGDDFVVRSLAAPVAGALPVVYVGHGGTVPGRHIDPYAGLDVRGKIVLAHGPRALPKGVAIEQIGRIAIGARPALEEAARRGAAGVIFIAQTSALGGWDQMRRASIVRRELEPPVPSAYAAPAATSILLAAATTDALMAGERVAGAEIRSRGDAEDYPASFQLKKTVTWHLPATTVVHRPYNVVAMVEGADSTRRREVITVVSHLDGAVGSAAVEGDAIYNSADDNATGSAAALAIAEQLARGPRPARSVIFLWDSGDEQGLWGSRYFVHRPPVPLDRIAALINIDMIGATRVPGSADAGVATVTGPKEVYLVGPGVLSAKADALLVSVYRSYLNLTFNRAYDRPESEFFYPRTDAGPFLERGILTIGYFTGIHSRYHRPSDETRFLDPRKMEAVARTVFAGLWMLADAAETPRIDKAIPSTVPRHR